MDTEVSNATITHSSLNRGSLGEDLVHFMYHRLCLVCFMLLSQFSFISFISFIISTVFQVFIVYLVLIHDILVVSSEFQCIFRVLRPVQFLFSSSYKTAALPDLFASNISFWFSYRITPGVYSDSRWFRSILVQFSSSRTIPRKSGRNHDLLDRAKRKDILQASLQVEM